MGRKNVRKTKRRLLSETGPTKDEHEFWALNASRIEELTK